MGLVLCGIGRLQMMDYLVYLAYPVLIGTIVVGAKSYGKGEWNEEFLSLKQTKFLQGFMALCIMLHHIGQETCASWNDYKKLPGLELFVPFGYYFVAIFMFFSGYGLYKSYKTKDDYLKGFFGKRVLPLIVAFYSTGFIFFIARILMKEKMTTKKVILYLTGLGMPNPNTWYVVVMPLLYAFFFLGFKFFKNDKSRITATIVMVAIYTLFAINIDHNDLWFRGEWWYNCIHLYSIGLIFAYNEKKLIEHLKKHYLIYMILLFVGIFMFYNFSEAVIKTHFTYYGEYWFPNRSLVIINRLFCLFGEMLASTAFAMFVILLGMKIKIGNRFLNFMGSITLEFYLIHGLMIELFAYKFCDVVNSIVRIENVALLILVVFFPSLLLAVLLKKFHSYILKLLTGKKESQKM